MKSSTYGIHILKAVALVFQVAAHARAWITLTHPISSVGPRSLLIVQLCVAALSMTIPMTAAAVLRLSLPLDATTWRIQRFNWKPYIWLLISLCLIESIKQACVYGITAFFEWDALHLISLSFLVILLIGRISVFLLWPISLMSIFAAPFLSEALNPVEKSIAHSHGSVAFHLSGAFEMVWSLLILLVLWTLGQNRALTWLHKRRLLFLTVLAWLLGLWLCYQISDTWLTRPVLSTLWIGSLTGTLNGWHIWGFFPWGGLTILGYLLYDLVVRCKAAPWLLWAFTLCGAGLITVFFTRSLDAAIDLYSPHGPFSGLDGRFFNRTPSMLFLIAGFFFLILPLGVLVERWGFESHWMRAVSRSILWIYIFETSILKILAPLWATYVSEPDLIWSYIVFSLVAMFVLAILIDRLPLRIGLTLRKNRPAA